MVMHMLYALSWSVGIGGGKTNIAGHGVKPEPKEASSLTDSGETDRPTRTYTV